MMYFEIPVFAYDCSFNRVTTEESAEYFRSAEELKLKLESLDKDVSQHVGAKMLEIAKRKYRWEEIGRRYFRLLESVGQGQPKRPHKIDE